VSKAVAALSEKESLAEGALAAFGPESLLRVGEIIPKFRQEPIVAALLSAPSPSSAIERWIRLQRYVHIKHPARVTSQSDRHVDFLHADQGRGAPSPATDLVLVSVIGALIGPAGGNDLTIRIGRPDNTTTIMRDGVRCAVPSLDPKCETGVWRFSWRNDGKTTARDGNLAASSSKASDAVLALVERDLLKLWTLQNLSGQLGVSARTLQRRLLDEGTTLSNLVRDARVRMAVGMLSRTRNTLGSIGFACGFSDSAHFARAFRARMGMPPSSYREMLAERTEITRPT
jgi:AraC-like DNA-binding protein